MSDAQEFESQVLAALRGAAWRIERAHGADIRAAYPEAYRVAWDGLDYVEHPGERTRLAVDRAAHRVIECVESTALKGLFAFQPCLAIDLVRSIVEDRWP